MVGVAAMTIANTGSPVSPVTEPVEREKEKEGAYVAISSSRSCLKAFLGSRQ
jgi:hypothetical protein